MAGQGAKLVDCVEVYMPKSIEFLSELYQLLREMVTNRLGVLVLDGFSIYEVDGVFRGEKLWEQRTLVIRMLFLRSPNRSMGMIDQWVRHLGSLLSTRVAPREEEIWICHYPQTVTIFTGLKRLLS